jgi:hypothetical protein
MRLTIFIALLTLGVSSIAVPAVNEFEPYADWALVEMLLLELQAECRSAMLNIYNDAMADNPAIGEQIGIDLTNASVEATALLDAVLAMVADESLTVELAEVEFAKLLFLFTQLEVDIQPLVDQLSQSTQNKIHADFNQFFGHINNEHNAIVDAINADPPTTTDPPILMEAEDLKFKA